MKMNQSSNRKIIKAWNKREKRTKRERSFCSIWLKKRRKILLRKCSKEMTRYMKSTWMRLMKCLERQEAYKRKEKSWWRKWRIKLSYTEICNLRMLTKWNTLMIKLIRYLKSNNILSILRRTFWAQDKDNLLTCKSYMSFINQKTRRLINYKWN